MARIEDKGLSPITNMNFMLQVDAVYDLPCKRVSNISYEMEYETIQEGGVNDYVQIRKKPASKPFTFEIERYIGKLYLDPLPIGKNPELPILLFVSSSHTANAGNADRVFCFMGCTVLSKSYGELNAEVGGLLTETTTIAFQSMSLVKAI